MLYRISNNWSFRRVLYTLMGGVLVFQSIQDSSYLGIGLGCYFAAMGVFNFGCASGNCAGGNCEIPKKTETN